MTTKGSGQVAVVFDGDDTLWSTEPLYDHAREAARAEVERAGLDGAEWDRLERQIDVENVRHMGFSVDRFPTSCVQAYELIARQTEVPVSVDVRERVRAAARMVFSQDPPLMSGAKEMLRSLRARGIKLALLTKGDLEVQKRRVERSGIAGFFDVISIVPEKPATAFLGILSELQIDPTNAWSVGNSVRSDILPAIEAGLRGVWIDAHVWEHERFEGRFSHDQAITVGNLSDVVDAIDTL